MVRPAFFFGRAHHQAALRYACAAAVAHSSAATASQPLPDCEAPEMQSPQRTVKHVFLLRLELLCLAPPALRLFAPVFRPAVPVHHLAAQRPGIVAGFLLSARQRAAIPRHGSCTLRTG